MKSLAMAFLHYKDCFCDCQGSRLKTGKPDVHVHSLGAAWAMEMLRWKSSDRNCLTALNRHIFNAGNAVGLGHPPIC